MKLTADKKTVRTAATYYIIVGQGLGDSLAAALKSIKLRPAGKPNNQCDTRMAIFLKR